MQAVTFRFGKLAFGKIRQFEIVEEKVDKLLAAQNESKRVFAIAFTRLGCLSAALARSRQNVALDELLVSGKHHVARAAFAAEARLIHAIEGD